MIFEEELSNFSQEGRLMLKVLLREKLKGWPYPKVGLIPPAEIVTSETLLLDNTGEINHNVGNLVCGSTAFRNGMRTFLTELGVEERNMIIF